MTSELDSQASKLGQSTARAVRSKSPPDVIMSNAEERRRVYQTK